MSVKYCLPIIKTKKAEVLKIILENQKTYDFFEIWLDYVEDLDQDFIEQLVKQYDGRLIFLFRRQNLEKITMPLKKRLEIMNMVSKSHCFVDLDISQKEELKTAKKVRLIASYHNYKETPADEKLDQIVGVMRKLKPAIYKVSTFCNSDLDALRLMDLLFELKDEKVKFIVLGMGEKGRMTRIAGAVLGNEFNFAPIVVTEKSAGGQLTKKELEKITKNIKLCYVIGNPVKQSLSPLIHNQGYRQLKIEDQFIFLRRQIKPENLKRFVDEIRNDPAFRGTSITLPHKLEIMKYLDEIDNVAQKIGAVNTVVKKAGRLKGYNTDYLGVFNPLNRMAELSIKTAAVLGAGGAARAAVYALTSSGTRVTVFNRDIKKAEKLAQDFNCEYDSLDNISKVADFDIVVNATKVGLNETDKPLVNKKLIKPSQIIFDVVYSPKNPETRFIKEAKQQGAQTLTGVDMLSNQAVKQFELFTGKHVTVEILRRAL